jgi:thiol:disulfide interchange protein
MDENLNNGFENNSGQNFSNQPDNSNEPTQQFDYKAQYAQYNQPDSNIQYPQPQQTNYNNQYTQPQQPDYGNQFAQAQPQDNQFTYAQPQQNDYDNQYTQPQQPDYNNQYTQPQQPDYTNQYSQPQQYNAPYYNQQYPNYNFPAERPKAFAITSLVMGLCSMFISCCIPILTLFTSIAGLILGIVSIKRNEAGKGMAIAGIIISAVAIVFSIVMIFVWIAALTDSSDSSYYYYNYYPYY